MSAKRTILVTGCSDGGLGSALALALHQQGKWRVFATARNLAKLDAVKAAGIECLKLDVGSEESIAACAAEIKQLTDGSLDGLVNNAGTGYSTPLIHVDIQKAHELFDLNVFSIIRVTRAFLPLLIKSQHGAVVANNTSGAGLLGVNIPFQGAYGASKAAAASLTDCLRLELAPFGVRVVNIVTGSVKTAFFDNSSTPGLPEDSIYNAAKEAIEGPMFGNQPGVEKSDATTWARQVAGDLGRRKAPYMIFRGSKAGTARLATLLPVGTLDGVIKEMSGLDVLERAVKDAGVSPGARLAK